MKHNSEDLEASLARTKVPSSNLSAGRLLVLVPPDLDSGTATHRIWELAVASGKCIQLLSLCKNKGKELSLRRQLVLISALIRNNGVFTEVKVEIGADWVDAVKRNYQTGDLIVCFAEQRAGFLHEPLHQILEENLDLPILILGDPYPEGPLRLNLLSRMSFWAGVISIITGAFFLQIRILALPREWAPTTLLILTVMAEFWLIWGWNKLFS